MRNTSRVVLIAAAVMLLAACVSATAAAAPTPGTLDQSFGSGGIASVSGQQLLGVAVQSDGQVIAAGAAGGRVLVERFGSNGQVTGTYSGPGGYARAVTIAHNGDIVVAGSVVVRLTPSLTPDPGFGSGGVAGVQGSANSVAVGSDGSVAVAGTLGGVMAVSRYSSSGGSQWTTQLGGANSAGNGVAVQSDGKIVAVGRQTPGQNTNGLVTRLNSNDGSLDSSFHGHGAFQYFCSGTGYTELNAVTVQGDGKIVASGNDLAGPYAIFARFNQDGSNDSGFGTPGGQCPSAMLMPSGEDVSVLESPIGAYSVAIAGGGHIVGAGGYEKTGVAMDAAEWALTSGGSAESSFGIGGTVRGPSSTFEACAIAVAPDGNLVAVGDTVSTFPELNPCNPGSSSSGFVSRRFGFGPPTPPPPPSGPPIVSTGAATGVTQTSATVSGQVNSNGAATTYHFDYGPTTTYGSSTPTAKAATGTSTVSAAVKNLVPGTTYHFRLVATNANGTTNGGDARFTTIASPPPGATTGASQGVTEVAATLTGVVNTHGLATTYHFDFGTTTSYGSTTRPGTLAAGTGSVNVSARLSRLRPGTTYHYRLVAHSAAGTTYGRDRTFKTLPRLRVALLGVSSSYRISVVEQHGLVVRVSCSQPCSITGSLVIPAGTARRLHRGNRPIVIGGGTARLARPGTTQLQLRLTSAGARVLSRIGQVNVTLQVVGRPTAGGPPVKVSKTATFKP